MMRFTSMNVVESQGNRLISLEYAKRFLRVDADDTDQDPVLLSLIDAVQSACETYLRRSLFPVTVETTWDCLPEPMKASRARVFDLPNGPVHSIESFKYMDVNGIDTTLATDQYSLDTRSEPAICFEQYQKFWPSVLAQPSSIRIRYRSGLLVPVELVAGSPSDQIEAEGHWFVVGDRVRYNAIGGDSLGGLTNSRHYTVAGVNGDFLTLSDGSTNIQPSAPATDEAVHVLGNIPQVILVGFLQLLSTWAEIREGVVVGTIVGAVPETCKKLWYPHRCLYF